MINHSKPELFSLNSEQISKIQSESRVNRQMFTVAAALSSMGLSACGGGGSSGSEAVSIPSTNTPQTPSTPTSSTAPTSNALTLAPSGLNYVSTNVAGFTQVNSLAHYAVADAADNEYQVLFSGSGTGMLTFEFDDAADIVSMESGSIISGFTDLKVINGTVDASNTDMGSIVNVSVASSVKLTVAQVLSLDAIVINADSGSVDVLVSTDEEVEQLTAAVSSGNLKLFSPVDDLLKVQAAPGSSVSAEKISESKDTMNATKRPVAEAEELGIAQAPDAPGGAATTPPLVFVSIPAVAGSGASGAGSSSSSTTSPIQGSASIQIAGAEDGLTPDERSDPISINIVPETGSDVVSVSVNGVTADNIAGDLYQFDGSSLAAGYQTVSVLTEAAGGQQALTEAQVWVVGASNNAQDMFDMRASQSGDVVTVSAYIKNLHSDLSDGLRSFDFWINLDESQFDYVEGSFTQSGAPQNIVNENGVDGEIFANGFFMAPWEGYDDAFFTFRATSLAENNQINIEIKDLSIYRTDFTDFSTAVEII